MELPRIALSVRQPWAWAIIHVGKDIENRSAFAVAHGLTPGRIAIHSAKGMTQDEYRDAADFMSKIGVTCPPSRELVRGAIIGHVTVTSIVKDSDSDWFFGPRGLVLADPVACEPIPAVGALGYFRWIPSGGSIAKPARWMLQEGRLALPPDDGPFLL